MADKRKRGQNFSLEDKDKLIKLLLIHKNTVLNKRTDGATNESKNDAWTAITNSFNSSSNSHRNKESLIKLWDKMKSESKLYHARVKNDVRQTGGGPSIVKFDPVMEQVCSILGRGSTGVLGVSDCDAENAPDIQLTKAIIIQNEQESVADELVVNTIESYHGPEIINTPLRAPRQVLNESLPDPLSNEDLEGNTDMKPNPKTPLWSRRRPKICKHTERSEAASLVASSYTSVCKMKETVEDLKEKLLRDELAFKRKLYELQLKAAEKDLQIKNAMLDHITGTGFSLFNLQPQQTNK